MLDEPRFREALTTRWVAHVLQQQESVDSTNLALKRAPLDRLSNGLLLFAEHQTRGRGQKARRWHSDSGENLTFSLLLRPREAACRKRISLLSLLAGLAVVRALEVELPEQNCRLKWPNDVLVNGRKIAGILTEVTFRGSRIERIVLGMGINVQQTDFGPQHGTATSIRAEGGESAVREVILARLLNEFEPLFERWQRADPALPGEINERLSGVGEWVRVVVDDEPLTEPLKFLGADLQGHLHFLTNEMTLTSFRHEQIQIEPIP